MLVLPDIGCTGQLGVDKGYRAIEHLQTWVAAVSQRQGSDLPSADEAVATMQRFTDFEVPAKSRRRGR